MIEIYHITVEVSLNVLLLETKLAETEVATILGIFPLWGVLLFKTPEGVVVGFQIFAWAPN